MAGKISELSAAAALTGAEQFELLQGGGNVREDLDAIKAFALDGLAIADVDGLQTALDGKAASSHTHTASNITDFAEALQDALNPATGFLVEGTGIDLAYDDVANTLTIAATGGGSSPLTTKGDIWVYGSADDRLPVGTNGQILSANSAEATGLDWIDPVNLGNIQETWSDGGTTYTTISVDVTDTASASASRLMNLKVGGGTRFNVTKNGEAFASNAFTTISGSNGGVTLGWNGEVVAKNNGVIGFNSGGNVGSTNNGQDTAWRRSAAGVMLLCGSSSSNGAAQEFIEQTAPSAPSANRVRIYAEDNGSGKTRLMALFPTGAAQQIAIEP